MKRFNKLADAERKRIMDALAKEEPGTDAYDKLLKEKEKLEEIEAKRRDGRIKPIDYFKCIVSVGTTAAIITADQWIPCVGQKLKLGEFVQRLIR